MRLLLTVTNNFAFKDRQQKARTILIMQTDSETIKSSNSASKNTKGITIFLFQIYTPYCVSHKRCENENKKSSVTVRVLNLHRLVPV